MTPQARQIIFEVAEQLHIDPMKIMGQCRKLPVVHARIEVAKRLRDRGYSSPRIGQVLGKDHTTILFYFGLRNKRPTPEKYGPITRRQAWDRGWRPPPKPQAPRPEPEPRKYLIPYAGADDSYRWMERPSA